MSLSTQISLLQYTDAWNTGDTSPGDSDQGEMSLRSVPREEAVRLAQEIADQHGRDLVVELPEEVEPEAERDVPEGNGEGSRENTLGRSSNEAATLETRQSRSTRNTTSEESDQIEQSMAEARAALRRGIRLLQPRATRYEELGDCEAAEAVQRQIDDMEAMESSI